MADGRSFRFDKAVSCANDDEAEAIDAAVSKDKFLRGMGVKRKSLKFSCEFDQGHLAASCSFTIATAATGGFPDLGAKRSPRSDAFDEAVEKWRERVTPSESARSAFEALRKQLADSVAGGVLKAKKQAFPPKFELYLPAKRGQHVWDFAAVSAAGADVYFDLYPLGLDVTLRDRVGESLRAPELPTR